MCTALNLNTSSHYFGRTLDLERSYGEEVVVMPRHFPIKYRCGEVSAKHFAMIGMATVVNGVPLYYDASNEHGLAMAGLNFPGNAFYPPFADDKDNITPFEFIPWILGQCKSVREARELLGRINLVNIPFSESLPLSPLHWIISDKSESVVVESMETGLHIHDNPVGVMTNNPPFEYHLFNLNNYRGISSDNGECTFSERLSFDNYCVGLGAMGLPGDVSSMSRFVRVCFAKENSVCGEGEAESVGQFFHVLGSVEMPRGVCKVGSGELDITVYTSCINTERGLYYYTTYTNRQISCVDMRRCSLDGGGLFRFPVITREQIKYLN